MSNKISKRLVFEPSGITIEKPSSFDPELFIPAENLSAIRLGVKWIRGYWFTLGRAYVIELLLHDGSIHKLSLMSVYGLRVQLYEEAWLAMINNLYAFYFSSQLSLYVELYQIKQSFELAGMHFRPDGISWDKNNRLYWNQIALSNYKSYFVVYHRDSPLKNKSFNFLNDWNACILQAVIKYVVEDHKKQLSR